MDVSAMLEGYAYPETAPWLRANMIATLDGGIQYRGSTSALGYSGDWALMQHLRTLADVVIMGATTVREYGSYPPGAPKLAIVSRSLRLDFEGPLFVEAPTPPIVVTCGAAPVERLREAERRAEVMVCGADSADMGEALQRLAEQGYARQLCEGGPVVLAEVAAAGWLHELCLTLSPSITAGDAARILDGPVIDMQSMELCHAVQDGNYLFLRYRMAQT
ncbi:dihydrofolate reductase family protein [Actinomadura rubrisoli]|uniref:dihydrofolate reductase family protein n=1 Tax=Actinomadura rubrisoli TaxID=2530368 RepID=UPI0014045830|nr:dihydrofolate reductase family protein [Actinomadura rubrisoli]